MNKKTAFDVLYVVLIVMVILFMIWVVIFLQNNAKECLANPMAYFEAKNSGMSCFCTKYPIYEKSYPSSKDN